MSGINAARDADGYISGFSTPESGFGRPWDCEPARWYCYNGVCTQYADGEAPEGAAGPFASEAGCLAGIPWTDAPASMSVVLSGLGHPELNTTYTLPRITYDANTVAYRYKVEAITLGAIPGGTATGTWRASVTIYVGLGCNRGAWRQNVYLYVEFYMSGDIGVGKTTGIPEHCPMDNPADIQAMIDNDGCTIFNIGVDQFGASKDVFPSLSDCVPDGYIMNMSGYTLNVGDARFSQYRQVNWPDGAYRTIFGSSYLSCNSGVVLSIL